jgi:hypothetical protein
MNVTFAECSADALISWAQVSCLAQRLYGLVVVAQPLMRKAPAAAATCMHTCNDQNQASSANALLCAFTTSNVSPNGACFICLNSGERLKHHLY